MNRDAERVQNNNEYNNTQLSENTFSPIINRMRSYNNSESKQECNRYDSSGSSLNYSPFVIKKGTNLLNSSSNSHYTSENFSNCNNNPKIYTPSPNNIFKERLSDRFIPINKGTNLLEKFEMTKKWEQGKEGQGDQINNTTSGHDAEAQDMQDNPKNTYSNLLESNFFIKNSDKDYFTNKIFKSNIGTELKDRDTPIKSNIFSYKFEQRRRSHGALFCQNSEEMNEQRESSRKINNRPYKVIEAPGLMDDFYLNLVDWSCQNELVVGQSNSVYLWCANKTQCVRLLSYEGDKYVSSVIWSSSGTEVAVGNSEGTVEIWDVNQKKLIRVMEGHTARVGVVSWKDNIISTGSKDYSIFNRDIRASSDTFSRYLAHKQEVCGLKWSFDGTQLASGGNDNKLMVWNLHSSQPVMKSSHHNAAVKAIAWSPHKNSLLASGGGTADRCIRFWNTSSLSQTNFIDTGSQVCNLVFSKTSNELVSTHGYSLNQVNVWKLPTMNKIATLTGHTFRVLYLGISPDGQNIVTGAGDQSLRFWNVFPPMKNNEGSCLFPSNCDMR